MSTHNSLLVISDWRQLASGDCLLSKELLTDVRSDRSGQLEEGRKARPGGEIVLSCHTAHRLARSAYFGTHGRYSFKLFAAIDTH